jgi:hypothetical protein
VSEFSPKHLKFKFKPLLKKVFYWPPQSQDIYGAPYSSLTSSSSSKKKRSSPKPLTAKDMTFINCQDWTVWTLFNFSTVGCVVMAFASVFVKPPPNYPHLWPLLISVFSAAHFLAFWVYFQFCQLRLYQENSCEILAMIEDSKKKN